MLNQDEFKDISDIINKGDTLTEEQIKAMLTTIYELDANLVIAQSALELSILNAQDVIPAVAEKVLIICGRTDKKTKNKVAKYAAEVTARFELAVQMYISGANEQAKEMLSKIASGEISLSEETQEESIGE